MFMIKRKAVVPVAALATLALSLQAFGQQHGSNVLKSCDPQCRIPGTTVDCEISVSHVDGFDDITAVYAVFDVVMGAGGDVRIPAEGPEVIGDTFPNPDGTPGAMIGDDDGICEPDEVCEGNLDLEVIIGAVLCADINNPALACDPSMVQNCVLPCYLGPSGAALNSPLGVVFDAADDGFIMFRQNTYVIQANDPDPLEDRATALWSDQCNSMDPSCVDGLQDEEQAADTELIECCGDNVVNDPPNETCDGTDAAVCIDGCRPPGDPDECTCCGDGIVQGNEECETSEDCPMPGQPCVACVCLTPALEVIKDCEDQPDPVSGLNDVMIMVTNLGSANLINCEASDELFAEFTACDNPDCQVSGMGEDVPLTPPGLRLGCRRSYLRLDGYGWAAGGRCLQHGLGDLPDRFWRWDSTAR
jgi:hypothetical protein